jgi:2'-5' RNA ligase
MTQLAVVSYPVVAPADRDWIESLRAQHDPQATLLAGHVTLVFPAGGIGRDIAAEVAAVARAARPIHFVIRWARAVRDVFGPGGHVFLVPDEGFEEITALHHALYGGGFASSRRPDVPFVPHITIGASQDFSVCERIARAQSPLDRQVRGRLEAIDLLEIGGGSVTSIAQCPLGG